MLRAHYPATCRARASLECAGGASGDQHVLIDAFTVGDEVPLVRWRLQANAEATKRVIIVESNMSIAGEPKRLWMHEELSKAELARYNVRLVLVPLVNRYDTEIKRTRAHYEEPARGGLLSATTTKYDYDKTIQRALPSKDVSEVRLSYSVSLE